MVDDIGMSPESIFLHSLANDMNGGRKTAPSDEARLRWAFLPEEEATVRSSCIFFKGLEYLSNDNRVIRLHQLAASEGTFPIIVKRVRDWTNHLFYRVEKSA